MISFAVLPDRILRGQSDARTDDDEHDKRVEERKSDHTMNKDADAEERSFMLLHAEI